MLWQSTVENNGCQWHHVMCFVLPYHRLRYGGHTAFGGWLFSHPRSRHHLPGAGRGIQWICHIWYHFSSSLWILRHFLRNLRILIKALLFPNDTNDRVIWYVKGKCQVFWIGLGEVFLVTLWCPGNKVIQVVSTTWCFATTRLGFDKVPAMSSTVLRLLTLLAEQTWNNAKSQKAF